MKNDYSIGLDIGTSSIGFSAVDDNGKLIRVKGDRAIGVRIYDEAQKAEERRSFRTARRRLSRRRWRLNFLREFFDAPVAAVDPDFFRKLKYYNESPLDEQRHGSSKTLFDTKTNSEFGHEYPTIYHLRHALMTEHRKFDVREIYLAVHHIVKYRGNFLNASPVSQFQSHQVDYQAVVNRLTNDYRAILSDPDFELNVVGKQLEQALLERNVRPSDRSKNIQSLLTINSSVSDDATAVERKNINTRNKNIISELGKALSGLTVRVDSLVRVDVAKEEQAEWKTTLETMSDFLALHEGDLDAEAYDIIEAVTALYSATFLTIEMPQGVSARMISVYEKHARDLKLLKQFANKQAHKERKELLDLYGDYINGKASKPVSQDDFSDGVKKLIKSSKDALATQILKEIDLGQFMPKPRSKANAMIPNQMQQLELDAIINNQKEYYPWLAEKNPVEAHLKNQPYKLDELVSFRVPYYNGPMITATDQEQTSGAKFAWMVRKADGSITPWNFDEKVDRTASATNFIERMKTTDTYLMGESVLPAASLLYQKFTVLNELNLIRVNGEHLSTSQKQRLFQNNFKQQSVVKKSDLVNMLQAEGDITLNAEPDVQGLSDSNKFNSKLSTYRALQAIIPEEIDKPKYQDDIEKIIEWSTLFEDANIFRTKLAEINWLNDDQRKHLAAKRYRGWGQLSAELLNGMTNSQGQTVIEVLATTSKNFMQVISDSDFAQKIEQHNSTSYTANDVIAEAYTSPSNRKALRQVLAVTEDIERATGRAPKYVYIEAADGPQKNPRRTIRREDRLVQTYQQNATLLNADVAKELQLKIKEQADFTDKLVLYFTQNGRDAYTDKPINIDRLLDYDIDHVIPQAFVKDNSLDNRVLTEKRINEKTKEKGFAIDNFPEMRRVWDAWRKAGLITDRKYRNLTLHERDFNERATGFIARQLVETRQIIKLAEQVLSLTLPKESAVINIKADLSHDFRETFDFPKNRNANDYHHAFDAHLAAFLGTYLRKQFPQYRSMLEYGKFDPIRNSKKVMRKANFIYDLVHSERKVNADGEVTWDKQADIKELNKVYEFKTMRVSYETSEYHGQLNDQTHWKKSDAAVNGGSKSRLVPAAANKPVELYGGFSGSKIAYLAIASFMKKNVVNFRVLPVFVRDVGALERARCVSPTAELSLLTKLVTPWFEKNVKGKMTVLPFEIVQTHVRLGTVFQNKEKGKFRLMSHTEYRNSVQLWLSKAEIKLIEQPHTKAQWERYQEPKPDQLLKLLDAIISREERANPLLKLKVEALKKLRNRFAALPVQDVVNGNKINLGMVSTLNQILAAFHANANIENLKSIGGPSDFPRVYSPTGIIVDSDTIMVSNSATSLFESTKSLK
mgnify:CR=1 FL=1